MKKKFVVKIAIDILMTVLLLFLMAVQVTGYSIHEWIGAAMFFLWVVHHILNRNWYVHLFKGKYSPIRIIQTAVDIILFAAMLGMMISGMILSRVVFDFLPLPGSIAKAHSLHVISAFWGFVLMALHLGLHWNMVFGVVQKRIGPVSSKSKQIILRIVLGMIVIYGLYAFLKNGFLSYMFMKSSFVYYDYERPVLFFFTEYIATMGLFVFLAHYGLKGIRRVTERRKKLEDRLLQ